MEEEVLHCSYHCLYIFQDENSGKMTSKYVERALLKISNGTPRQIYNILVEIRTKVIKSSTGIRELIQHGFVHKSLFLLSDDVRKQQLPQTTDIILSVLGNLCMEEKAREDVHKSGGIPTIADLFCTSESVSIQNRSCRALSNAAMLSVNADSVFGTDTVDRVAELLQLTPSKESKLIYCRILRLLGKTQKHLEKLVVCDAVRCVVKLLSDEDKDVKSAALRMVFETSNQGCSSGFASQVVSAGGIAELLSGVTHEDSTTAHQSFTTLIRLADHSHARAELGNAGGITQFIDYFEGLGNFDKDKRFSVLNVLCLCCKDVVNRVKIRDNNILPKFLDSLKDNEYKRLHDRVISALLCFLYDESSLELLLQKGLIPLLLTHLQRVAAFTSNVVKLDIVVAKSSKSKSSELDITADNLKAEPDDISHECQTLPIDTEETKGQTEAVLTNIEQGPLNLDEDTAEEPTVSTEKKYHYSIDSPTYQVSSEWNLDAYSQGAKCKSFNHEPTSPQYSSTSPLSTISYYSPSLSPEDYSPTSPTMSKVNEDPNYGLVCSLPFTCSSPEKQPSPSNASGLSPGVSENEFGLCSDVPMVYSDEEESQEAPFSNIFSGQSENAEQTKEASNIENIPLKNRSVVNCRVEKIEISNKDDEHKESIVYHSQGFDTDVENEDQQAKEMLEHHPMRKLHFDLGEETINSRPDRKNKLPPTSPETFMKYHVSKKPRLLVARRRSPTATENHILMILSFVSQMPDPTKYLVSTDVLCCLLDYISCVQVGETRAARVLCRLARNPNCFEKLIQLNLPWMVYEKLLSQEDNDHCWIKILQDKHSGLENRTDRYQRSRSWSLCSDDSSFLEEDIQDFSTSMMDGKLKSPQTTKSARNSLNNSIQQNNTNVSSERSVCEEEEISLSSRAGINVLQDLCRMADSPYGRGVVAHILSKQSVSQMDILVSLLHILWARGMWKFYFFKKGLWKEYMDILTAGSDHPYYILILEAFCFLGKVINFDIKLRNEQCEKLFKANVTATDKNIQGGTCRHGSYTHDIQFNVQDTVSTIPACKERLTKASPLFAAMLQGKYSESTQNTITLKDTSYYAVQFVVHFLHGCDLKCDVISDILSCEPGPETWSQCVEVLTLVNRYLVSDLELFLKSVLSSRFLGPIEANSTYSFAKLHGYEVLASDCVKTVLVGGTCVYDRIRGFSMFLNGPNSERFLSHLEQLFKSNIH
ncbi:armadillo repeat-containing protein 5-like [Pecten maximus]|uniref:armadillo repeat-containing protein 5-like n=1 Tax=Pecten maximus TaxID=6579 RepID=UPI001458211B|nr:armadillo repeat-containing protein 5-like [Pecten maximus]